MRNQAIVVCCCGLMIVAGAFGQAKRGGNDGLRWKTLSPFEKNLYVLGFSRGYEQGRIEGMGAAATKMLEPTFLSSLTPEQKTDASKLAAQAREHASVWKAVSVSQLTATVDTFYGDYRNMAVCWNDAVLLSSVTLGGHVPSDESLRAARKNGSECN